MFNFLRDNKNYLLSNKLIVNGMQKRRRLVSAAIVPFEEKKQKLRIVK